MAFISTTFASRYPPTNNQLRTSSNPRNQATIQDGSRVNRNMRTNTANQAKIVRCYNCQDCDEAPSAYAVLMAKLSTYDSDVLSESNIDITSDSNIISYDQYLKETENEVVQDTTSSA
ncbi:hypothetical protein Tco_0979113 [Tanacetum coccineum]